MKLNYKINLTEEVSLIIIDNAPAEIDFAARILEYFGKAGVNVDMISQAPPHGMRSAFSFSMLDSDLDSCIHVIKRIREEQKGLKVSISSGNSKIVVFSEEMPYTPGVAAAIFRTVANTGADMRLISTSECEVSFLVTSPFGSEIIKGIKAAFE